MVILVLWYGSYLFEVFNLPFANNVFYNTSTRETKKYSLLTLWVKWNFNEVIGVFTTKNKTLNEIDNEYENKF